MESSKKIENIFIDKRRKRYKQREEVEVKFIVPKKVVQIENKSIASLGAVHSYIEQYYLSEKYFESILNENPELKNSSVNEIRIRKKNGKHLLTAKGGKSKANYIRFEVEKEISNEEFEKLKKKSQCGIIKNRYSFESRLGDIPVHVDIDDYIANSKGELHLDFVTCEVEVPSKEYAKVLISGKFFIPELIFLRQGLHTVYVKGFSNRQISEKGFPGNNYKAIVKFIRKSQLEEANRLAKNANRSKNVSKIYNEVINLWDTILLVDNPPTAKKLDPEGIGVYQNILQDFKFTQEQSLGSEIATERLNQLDLIGKGWSQDFHTISTSIPFRRLFLKPQVFRVNEGSVDTTTRGTHTMDVISISQQLCKHLGLNDDFAAAMAALHDIGHPPLGHVGEKVLEKLSRKKFYHHYFSLSLTEIFGMNLLKEILLGAALHKTGRAPFQLKNQPLEITIVRIADKVSYVSRDVFDGIRNSYLRENDIPQWIYNTLGKTSDQWIEKFIDTIVRESALEHNVNFSEKSGAVFKAYKYCQDIIFEKLHRKIHWQQAVLNLEIAYRYIEKAFSDLDPIVITAYMTDEEVGRLADLVESNPDGHIFPENELESRGFGFLDVVNAMRLPNFDNSRIYYTKLPTKLIKKRGV